MAKNVEGKDVGGRPRKSREFTEVEKFWIEAKAHVMPIQEIADAIIAPVSDVESYISKLPPPPEVAPKMMIAIDAMGKNQKDVEVGKPSRYIVMTETASSLSDAHRDKNKLSDKLSRCVHKIPRRNKPKNG